MYLFRRSRDVSQAHTRLATVSDLPRIARLLRDGVRRYYGLHGSDLPGLLTTLPVVVVESGSELWGVALSGWHLDGITWLRGLALARGVEVHDGLDALLPFLHTTLRRAGLKQIFYCGDDVADTWLLPALIDHGYVLDTNVVVYEKKSLTLPDYGNQFMHIRRAESGDLDALITLDRLCFEPHWTKDHAMLGPAIAQGALFLVAVQDQEIVGYTYATSHFNGRLVHLVRLAVNPVWRGLGIGVRLLAEVVLFARYQHADLITLNTQSYNASAQRIYRWFGFVPTGESQSVLRYELMNDEP
ncbi:MAG: GNAT family N-acetyltransferase [Chloroflexaceae bacterium]|nr:GNAT family N-acetyltransferase [Chloroflexaceae bacterium]